MCFDYSSHIWHTRNISDNITVHPVQGTRWTFLFLPGKDLYACIFTGNVVCQIFFAGDVFARDYMGEGRGIFCRGMAFQMK